MRLHNTLTRHTEDFKSIEEGYVKLYNCGPTVYDYAHLGNLRAYVFTDTLRRVLDASGYKVKQVMNITDVGHLQSDEDEGNDKLEEGANREAKTVWEVADFYTEAFKRDISQLNVLVPNGYHDKKRGDNFARATEFINDQINIVKVLQDKGYAYLTDQAIYFEVTKLANYGQLTGQKLSDKETAARPEVITDSAKKHPQDFALWFFTTDRFKDHSMHWSSPWGEGFPGWHLECSAIIHATLGEPIDIHTGGVDHIGTHHSNEIAQTEAAFGKKLANYWLHNEHMFVEGRKMSKSLGNFYTLRNVIDRGYDPLSLRLLFLQSHYRTQANFTWEALEAAQSRLKDLYDLSDLKHQSNFQAWVTDEKEQTYSGMISKQLQELQNDLDSPSALSLLSQYISHIRLNGYNPKNFQRFLTALDGLYGLDLANRSDISDNQKQLIYDRESARQAKNWAKADALRKVLENNDLEINDTDRGPIWSRK
jgi:cysteinyl-tRNA synthetase